MTDLTAESQTDRIVRPKRIQRKRAKGWRMPDHTWAVGRPGRWGNPFKPGLAYRWADGEPCPYPRAGIPEGPWERAVTCESVEQAVEWYRTWITQMVPSLASDAAFSLRGWNLACWCPLDQPCHADVLLEIANGGKR